MAEGTATAGGAAVPDGAGIARPMADGRNPRGAFNSLRLLTQADIASGGGASSRDAPGAGSGDGVRPAAKGRRTLRIFHFNDLHHALRSGDGPLFSRIVARYRRARIAAADDEIVLLVAGGDDHTGTPFDELLGWSADELVVDPAYACYSAAGVDVGALGNHDLDRGSAVLVAGIAKSAAFPIVSANIEGSRHLVEGRHYHPAAIGVARGLRIGFLGLTTPVDTRVGTSLDPDLRVTSPIAAIERWVPALASRSDVVVVMSHCGFGDPSPGRAAAAGLPYIAEGDIAIASRCASLTDIPLVIVGGHSHTVLNAEALDTVVDGVPIVQAGGHGSHVGEFSATFAIGEPRAAWVASARLYPLGGDTRDPHHRGHASAAADADAAFENTVIEPLAAGVRSRIEEVVGLAGNDVALGRERTLVDRFCGECLLANFIADALVARSAEFAQGPVDFAIVNSTAIADGVPVGQPVRFSDWYRVQPFADCLQVTTLTGAQLERILASNARRIVRPDERASLENAGGARPVSRGLLHFSSAVRYAIAAAAGSCDAQAVDASVGGTPLPHLRDATFRVALTNYIGTGGEGWNGAEHGPAGPVLPFDVRALPRIDTGLVFRNEVLAHIRATGRIDARIDGRLRVPAEDS